MPSIATIHTPSDSSLEERATSYQRVYQEQKNIDNSLKQSNQKNWADRLGSHEELLEAKIIIDRSLNESAKSFNSKDLQQAQQQNLLTKDDVKNITILKRKSEMKEASQTSSKSSSKSRKL